MMRATPAPAPVQTWRPRTPRQTPAHIGASASSHPVVADARATRAGLSFFLFCVLTFVLVGRPQDYISALVPFRLALVMSLLTALVTFFQRPADDEDRVSRLLETKLYLMLFVIMCVGIPFSMHRRISFEIIIYQYLANVIFFVLFVTHVNTLQKYKRVLFTLVVATTLFTLVGLVEGQSQFGRYGTGSQMFDPNDVAFVELSLLPFALSILLGRFQATSKAIALTGVLLGVLLALYTGSRGGLLGLVAFFLVFFALRMGRLKKVHKALMLVTLTVAIALNADKINVDRYLTITDLSEDYNMSDEFGRKQIWEKGLRIFMSDPLTGVGVGNFAMALGNLRLAENLIPKWQQAHNAYLQIATETGIFGIVVFLWLIVVSLRTLNRLRKQIHLSGPAADLNVFSAMLLAGGGGLLVGAFFLTQGYSLFFTLFFATATALRRMAAKEGWDRPQDTTTVQKSGSSRFLYRQRTLKE